MYLASYVEPKSDTDFTAVEIQVTLSDAVQRMRQAWRASPSGQRGEVDSRSDEEALDDFVSCHGASFLSLDSTPVGDQEQALQGYVAQNMERFWR